MIKVLKWMTIFIAGVGTLTNLPALILGFSFLGEWVRLHTSNGPYFRWQFLGAGALCLLFSGLGLGLAARTIVRENFRLLSSVVALVIGLGGMIELPEVSPRLSMADAVQKILGHADQSLSNWDEIHGKFPTDEKEVREAMAVRPLTEPPIFFLNGMGIPYDVRIITNASGPSVEPLPPNPGTIVYAISADYKEYWLAVTTLRKPIGGPVRLEHLEGIDQEPILVMNRKHHNPGEDNKPFIE